MPNSSVGCTVRLALHNLNRSAAAAVGLPAAVAGAALRGPHRAAARLLRQVGHCDVGNALGVPSQQLQVCKLNRLNTIS